MVSYLCNIVVVKRPCNTLLFFLLCGLTTEPPWCTMARWLPSKSRPKKLVVFYINTVSKPEKIAAMKIEIGGFCVCMGSIQRVGEQPHGNCVGQENQAFRKQQAMQPPPSVCSFGDSYTECLSAFKWSSQNLEGEKRVFLWALIYCFY